VNTVDIYVIEAQVKFVWRAKTVYLDSQIVPKAPVSASLMPLFQRFSGAFVWRARQTIYSSVNWNEPPRHKSQHRVIFED
jgi:hypothetical protein